MRWAALLTVFLLGACGPEPEVPCPGGEDRDAAGECLPPCEGTRITDRCVVAGVPADGCGVGFESNGTGGCAARRPETACGENEMALPGELACRPVMPCGTAPWGELARPAGTLHVLAAADPSLADGSESAPYATITAALDAAPAGARIVLGPGTYVETLFPDRPVELVGLCPDEVLIDGRGAGAAIFVELVDDVTLSGATLIGSDFGAAVIDGTGFLLDRVVVHEADIGLLVSYETAPTEGTLRSSLMHSVGTGVAGLGGTVRVEDSELRAIRSTSPTVTSVAIMAIRDLETSVAFVSGSVLQDVFGYGVAISGSVLTLTDTLIQRVTAETPEDGGMGVVALFETAPLDTAEVTLVGSVIEDTAVGSYYGETLRLVVERTTLTGARDVDGSGTGGICLTIANPNDTEGSTARVTDVYLGDCDLGGLIATSTDLVLTRTAIVDPGVATTNPGFGHGLVVFPSADGGDTVRLEDVVIERPREVGVFLFGVETEATGLVIRDAVATSADFGDGVSISADVAPDAVTLLPASFTGSHLLIERSGRAGLSAFGADLFLSSSRLLCNGLALNQTETIGTDSLGRPVTHPGTVTDGGDNVCGCGQLLGNCRAETQTLTPASPPELPPRPGF